MNTLRIRRMLPWNWPIHPKYHKSYCRPKVVYLIALPRTGSTVAKRYLGDHPGLTIAPNDTHQHAWRLAKRVRSDAVVIDKRSYNINKLDRIYLDFGNRVWFAALVRDPRDELVSLMETDRHPKVPRTERFWPYWLDMSQKVFNFAGRHAETGNKICLIRYEDLITNPTLIKQRFLQWLGIETTLNDLSNSYSNTSKEIADGINMTEDWKAHGRRTVHAKSMGRWASVTNPERSKYLRSYNNFPDVESFMRQLGYADRLESIQYNFRGMEYLGK